METGELQHILDKHKGEIFCTEFDPTSKFFASGSKDNRVNLWSFQTGNLLYDFNDHYAGIVSVKFNLEG